MIEDMCDVICGESKDDIKAEFCTSYCKYPSMLGEDDLLEMCETCPLDRM